MVTVIPSEKKNLVLANKAGLLVETAIERFSRFGAFLWLILISNPYSVTMP